MKKTICFEFDGVVHVDPKECSTSVDVIKGQLVPGMNMLIAQLQEDGYHVMIRSDRCYHSCGTMAIAHFLEDHCIKDVQLCTLCPMNDDLVTYVVPKSINFEAGKTSPLFLYHQIQLLGGEINE